MPTEKQLANLIPTTQLSKSEAREMGSKGGKKSAETRRFLKTFREAFENMNDKDGIIEELCRIALHQAKKGNIRALEFVRDTMGQKPIEKVEATGNLQVKKVFITPEMDAEAEKLIDSLPR